MRTLLGLVILCLVAAAGAGCQNASSGGPAHGAGGAGGSSGGGPGAAGSSAGTSGGAGSASSAGSSGGSGAAAGTTGGAGSGAAGSSVQMDAGAAGAPGGGDAGVRDAVAPGDGPAGRPAKPSAGCGKANPAMGSRTIMTGGQTGMFNVHLPTGYVATTPVPLGLGFHGFGNGACGPTTGECQGFANLPAVTVYMKSFSDGWEQAPVLEQNITFFQDVVALMKNEYCIDENRIFVAGVSSGGQFVEYLACRFGDWLWQVTPVSASVVGAANTAACKGTPPILVIHGVTDMAGNYGQGVAQMFAKRNGCSANLPAGLAQAKIDLMAAFTAKRDEHVCLDWDGCTANPVRFCISSQITYSGLTHGWPKVGGMLISDFLGGLK
jgi:polyhydroxybutyrate depolymerase